MVVSATFLFLFFLWSRINLGFQLMIVSDLRKKRNLFRWCNVNFLLSLWPVSQWPQVYSDGLGIGRRMPRMSGGSQESQAVKWQVCVINVLLMVLLLKCMRKMHMYWYSFYMGSNIDTINNYLCLHPFNFFLNFWSIN